MNDTTNKLFGGTASAATPTATGTDANQPVGTAAAFGKQMGESENNPVTADELKAIDEGSREQTSHNESMAETDKLVGENLALMQEESGDNRITWTSHPIVRFNIGKFQFENGVAKLTPAESKELEEMLKGFDLQTQNSVRKIDSAAGELVAKKFLELNSRTTSGMDTSADRPGPAAV